MKKIIVLLLLGMLVLPHWLQAQNPPDSAFPRLGVLAGSPASNTNQLTRFNLVFVGGPPRALVAAIEKAHSHPLNVIIPDELIDVQLPALKMNAVTVPELFDALTLASQKQVYYSKNQWGTESYGFKTVGTPREDSIWVFYRLGHPMSPDAPSEKPNSICRYYQLAPYLETYKVEDITTAIETGCKMMGDKNPPKMSFHNDTKLLIAVGEDNKLQLIDSVLQQLMMQINAKGLAAGLPPITRPAK